MQWKGSTPSIPLLRNEAHLGIGVLHPPFLRFFPQKDGKADYVGRELLGFPVKQACCEAFRQRFPRLKTQNPSLALRSIMALGSSMALRYDSCGIFARNAKGAIMRPMIDEENFVARIKCFEQSSEPECVVMGMDESSDRRHRIGGRGPREVTDNLIPCRNVEFNRRLILSLSCG